MSRFFVVMASLWAFCTPVSAQQYLGEYYTTLGYADMQNSRGKRLDNFCAVVRQDRANFHHFGIRDQGDQGDRFFGSRSSRAMITGSCWLMPGSEYVAQRVLSGEIKYIWVRVLGINGVPTQLQISEGAG